MKKYLLIASLVLPVVLPAQKNSQWRGEGRDGVYNETGLMKEWPAEGPELLWKHEGLGDGYTSAAIANQKIYITGLSGNNDLVLHVLDMAGKPLARKEMSREWTEGHGGPRSTVCVDDGKLYVYSAFGKLYCLDEATLDEVWTKDLFADLDGRNITWGVSESPLIVGETLFMTPGGVVNNMVAMNKNTGDVIWSSLGEGTVSAYCSPIYIDDPDIPIVVNSTFDYIIGWNASTGEKLWSVYRTSEFNNHPNTPLHHDGMIFSSSGDGAPAVMLRLKNGGREVEQVWQNGEVDTQMGGAIRIGDHIYTSGHKNRYWFCVDWNTGETRYKTRDITGCSVIFADGMLYCYSERGTMNLVKPDPEKFESRGSFRVDSGSGAHFAHPVIHEGVLYIRHGDALMAYKVK